MKNLKHILFTLLITIATQQLFAHALWIETKSTGKIGQTQEVKIFYGEFVTNEKDSVAKWFSDVKEFSLWLTSPGKGKIKLNTTAGANFYSAYFTPEKDGVYILSVVHEPKELGGTTKYEFSSLATVAVGKTSAINTSEVSNAIYTSVSDSKIYNADVPVKIKAVLNGKPLANKNISVFSPEGWSKEYTTDKNGEIEFSPLWAGRYILEISNYEKTSGEHHNKNYTAFWQCGTSTFEVK
ncbi:DUF4198 domain-containing protein [Pedobacter alpinus]|uniref:DUF4198 domain-containing protein n=1 Tax=Pedobacter alpinus TaxID=1590643 RepID=A0ABW5TSG2_9SPHI